MTGEQRHALRLAISERRRALVGSSADGIPHGTVSGYSKPHRCRCADCGAASAAARRARRALENKEERNRKDREYRRRRSEARKAAQ